MKHDHGIHDGPEISDEVHKRAAENFARSYRHVACSTDRLFMWLILAQWMGATLFAWWFSPLAWAGKASAVHSHVFVAFGLGGLVTSLPVYMVLRHPGTFATRCVVVVAQALWSALLIHLTGGRIETHFHVFISLAIIAFYRDVKVMIPATLVVTVDHFVRGLVWPESIYGVLNPEWWRFMEHAGWVVFLDVFLVINCMQSYRELQDLSMRQAEVEAGDDRVRLERLAAVGQLAASVGHELRNPLAAIRNAQSYIQRRIERAGGNLEVDARLEKMVTLIRREVEASSKIIGNLLDFSRPKTPERSPCPLAPLVAEAIEVVPTNEGVEVISEVSEELPIPDIDRDMIRQALVNLVQNAVEAMPPGRAGRVVVRAAFADDQGWRIEVEDNGDGIDPAVIANIYKPLFSTKAKGTGLGLAVVRGAIERHGGHLDVKSEKGHGCTFTIDLPPLPSEDAASNAMEAAQ